MQSSQLAELLEKNVKKIISNIDKKIRQDGAEYRDLCASRWVFFRKRRKIKLEKKNLILLGKLAGWEDIINHLGKARKASQEKDYAAAIHNMELVRIMIIRLSKEHLDLSFLAEGFIGCFMGSAPGDSDITEYFVKKYSRSGTDHNVKRQPLRE